MKLADVNLAKNTDRIAMIDSVGCTNWKYLVAQNTLFDVEAIIQ